MTFDIAYTVKGVTRQYVMSLSRVLTKAKAHAAHTGSEEKAFLEARLYPDMHPMI